MPAKAHPPAFVARALAVLAANNGSLKAAAGEIGISRSTLRGWRDGRVPLSTSALSSEERVALSEEAGESTARQYRDVKVLYIEQLKKPEVVRASSALQAATVGGIMADKEARVLGKPTDRTEHVLSLAAFLASGDFGAAGPPGLLPGKPVDGAQGLDRQK